MRGNVTRRLGHWTDKVGNDGELIVDWLWDGGTSGDWRESTQTE